MEHHAAAGWPTSVISPGFMYKDARGAPYDPLLDSGPGPLVHGGSTGGYAQCATTWLTEHFAMATCVAVGAGWTNWAVESFMDEAAHAVGAGLTVEFRLRLLDGSWP